MSAFFISFVLIFFAELGDKSQFIAMWFATRYAWWLVLLAVAVVTLAMNLVMVLIGASVGEILPEKVLMVLVGLAFYVFAFWGLKGETLDEAAFERLPSRVPRQLGAFGVIATGFYLSELGDKTQLATLSLAGSEDDTIGVWLGSTLGMVASAGLAIAVGVFAGKRLPAHAIAKFSALLFAIFGTLALVRAGVLIFE
jgi:Ca2+/H+ antiporter, TMEM165/GDT1 family